MICITVEQDADINHKFQSDFKEHILTSKISKNPVYQSTTGDTRD